MKDKIIELLSKYTYFSKQELGHLIEIPTRDELGDYAFPCFVLAKTLRKAPAQIATDLVANLKKQRLENVTRIEASGPYVNFFLDKIWLAKRVLKEAVLEDFGKSSLGKGKSLGIEFSQPNTHKAFHIGHIRGTSLGESIARIAEFEGNRVVRINYSGDSGMHIAKWIWCYSKYHSREKLKTDESWIAGIYVDAVRRLSENEKLQDEVDKINRKIESRDDKKITSLWKKTRTASIKSWKKIYKQLGATFDKHYFESEMEEEAKALAEDLMLNRVAKKDDAIFMDLKEDNLGVWVLVRKDGTVLYSAKDLVLAKRKVKEFGLDRYLVTVGEEQKLHFQQLKRTLELIKFPEASVYNFLAFGKSPGSEGPMSSRTGNNVLYSEFFKEVSDLAVKGLRERNPKVKAVKKRSEKIALACIKYSMLKQDPNKSIIFDQKEEISFEGNTGPYLLYTYARANSIKKKVKSKKKLKIWELKPEEIRLLKKIDSFGSAVDSAYHGSSPNTLANYAFELCQIFNEFYHNCPVKGSEEEMFRLKLVDIFMLTMKKAMNLLGIDLLDEM